MTSLNMGNEIVVIDDMGVKTFDEKFLPLSRVNINPEIKLAECIRLAKDKDGNLVTINVSGLGIYSDSLSKRSSKYLFLSVWQLLSG